MSRLSGLLAVCLMLVPYSLSQNKNNKLKGDFPFNESITVVQQPASNGACPSVLTGPVSEAFVNDHGIWSFDGKGNVDIKDSGQFIAVNPPTDGSQVTPVNSHCVGTYNVLDDSTVDFHYNCSTDNFVSYFQVHTTGTFTKTNILVEAWNNPDGSLQVTPYVYGNTIVGCSYVLENTTVTIP